MSDQHRKIDEVNWSEFSTAYGVADNVPSLLKQLSGSDAEKAMAASHHLWCGLCHQHAYLSSAALPSYPILLNTLHSARSELAVEILDILWGFAQCSSPKFVGTSGPRPGWMVQLHDQMIADREAFAALAASEDEDLSHFAKSIVEELDKPKHV